MYFNSDEITSDYLRDFSIEDLWGIGHKYASKLSGIGIKTALELRCLPLEWMSRNMTVVGLRIVLELQGTSCIPLEMFQDKKKGLAVRSNSAFH